MSYRILVTQPDLRGAKSFVWHTHSSAAAMCTIPEKFCLPSNCSFLFFVVPKCGASSKLISVSGHNMEQAREGDTTQAVAPESNETWVVEAAKDTLLSSVVVVTACCKWERLSSVERCPCCFLASCMERVWRCGEWLWWTTDLQGRLTH